MRLRITIALLVACALWIGSSVEAEVRSITDRYGNYQETRFLFQETQSFGSVGPNIWTPIGLFSRGGATLNPNGDILGDLWPAVADSGRGPHYAWAVWSRLSGLDYELVWSRWTAGGWRVTSWVYPSEPNPGHDLDPSLAYDESGRPYLVWWRDNDGRGEVYLSLFLLTQWMIAYPVSDADTDARYPTVVVEPAGEILVTYEAPDGVIEQTILFDEPVTITDDIDPLDYITNGGSRYIEDGSP